MKILVDTCIWSLALRRNKAVHNPVINELHELISELRVQLIGPVRQEILSGVRSAEQFDRLKNHLQAFPDFQLESADYECAAEFYNNCRGQGVQGSNTDFLICAISVQHRMPVFTIDNDFKNFQQILPIVLHHSRFRM